MKRRPTQSVTSRHAGFTLLELLAAMAILLIMTALLFQAFGQASRGWLQAENRVETFSQARAVLDFMSKEISQAIVNSNITFLGDANDIAFVAPVNTGTNAVDLVEVVYRLSLPSKAAPGAADPGSNFVDNATTWPKRLVRRTSHFGAPTTECWNYGSGASGSAPPWDFYGSPNPNPNWPETSDSNRTAVLAENVMSITFQYYDATNSIVQSYWNSDVMPTTAWQNELPTAIPTGTLGPGGPGFAPVMTNRSPASVQITLTMIDSKAAALRKTVAVGSPGFMNITNQALRTFSTFVAIPNRQP